MPDLITDEERALIDRAIKQKGMVQRIPRGTSAFDYSKPAPLKTAGTGKRPGYHVMAKRRGIQNREKVGKLYLDGMKPAAIAAELGVTLTIVKTQLQSLRAEGRL